MAEGSTLHVYSTLLQIPVLVLGSKHEALPPLDPASFLVSLGKNVPFKPLRVRLEGDDPVTLAILLDGSTGDSLVPLAADGLAAMAGERLRPQDRVAVYTMDGCKLRRMHTLAAVDVEAVRTSVQHAVVFSPWQSYGPHAEPCPKPVGVWDAIDFLSRGLAAEPGRRVVLAVTNGANQGGLLTADAARRTANLAGVTVFAVAERFKVPILLGAHPQTVAGWRVGSMLGFLTEGSGGLTVEATRNNLPYAFAHFVELLRGRYILEFQRPANVAGGTSIITVQCGLPHAFIRPAGTSLPTADPVTQDPAVQHGPAAQLDGQPGGRVPRDSANSPVK